jgi:hypothetical protein
MLPFPFFFVPMLRCSKAANDSSIAVMWRRRMGGSRCYCCCVVGEIDSLFQLLMIEHFSVRVLIASTMLPEMFVFLLFYPIPIPIAAVETCAIA